MLTATDRNSSTPSPSGVQTKAVATIFAEAASLEQQASEVRAEQQALLEAASVETQYGTALAAHVEAKHDQVERIETKLEGVIEQQEAKLHQIQAKQPGILSLPSTRASWQAQVQQQQALLQSLHGRLEGVREIKEGMGLYGPRIEELATRKLRLESPELAEGWDDMRAAQRAHAEIQRKKKQREDVTIEREQAATITRGHTQGLSLSRSIT